MPKSALFLIGAGASYGSLDCIPYCPPLGARLFAQLQVQGGVASKIRGPLKELFEQNFELGMVAFREQRERDVPRFLREMAAYFVQFEAGPANLYRDLVRIVASSSRPAVVVTTNYDLLIEQVIGEAGLFAAYHAYPVPENNIPLLKIHGSCHFLPDIPPGMIIGAQFFGCAANVESPVRIARSRAEIIEFCRSQGSLAPAVALYAPGKGVLYSPSIVFDQQNHWRTEVARAQDVFVIGLRVIPEDDHIWGVLAKSPAQIHYVGFEPDEIVAWTDAMNRDRPQILARDFQSGIPRIASILRL